MPLNADTTKLLAGINSQLLTALPGGESALWQTFIRTLGSALDCEAASFFATDDEHRLLTLKFALGNCADDITNLTFGYKGVVGEVALSRKALVVNNAAKDPAFYKMVDKASGFQTRAILCVPVLYENTLLGVIEMLNPKSGSFSAQDLELANCLCLSVAKTVSGLRKADGVK